MDRPEESVPLAGLAWVQFGYPVKAEWVEDLRACWVEPIFSAPQRALLVAAAMLEDVVECGPVQAWGALVEPVLSTDRVGPDVLDWHDALDVVLAPGVTLDSLRAILPPEVIVIEQATEGQVAMARLEGLTEVGLLLNEAMVLQLVPRGEQRPSDERQALILARQWDPSTGEPFGPFPTLTGYKSTYNDWLDGRGLAGSANQQTIAFFDTGVDIGLPLTSYHPDIQGRVLGSYNITVSPPIAGFLVGDPFAQPDDRAGHGTHVIGTAIGAGGDWGRDPAAAIPEYTARGQGIAPEAYALSVERFRSVDEQTGDPDCTTHGGFSGNQLGSGQNWAATFTTPATIANHSWNELSTAYSAESNNFERWVRDSSSSTETVVPMTVVFSAGNWRPECVDCGESCPAGCTGLDQDLAIRAPANAKNVITVGSVDSWTPATTTCPNFYNTYDVPGGPFQVSKFSTCGPFFGPAQVNDLHVTRVKPDVVAPGWRIDGPLRVGQPCPDILCDDSPLTGANFSYARGTSFTAPAGSGSVALKSKQFRDGNANSYPVEVQAPIVPTPTLLKAALIATAQSLGPEDPVSGLVDCDDCRPSNAFGWGLIDLDRLTETNTPIYVHNEGHGSIDGVGDGWTSAWLKPGRYDDEILVAVVWNDVPTSVGTSSALLRDLDVTIEVKDSSLFFVGNNFEENLVDLDTGYSQGFGFADFSVRDHANNVEAVFMLPDSLIEGEEFRIHVTSFAHPVDFDFPEQRFSVYVWNARCAKLGRACF